MVETLIWTARRKYLVAKICEEMANHCAVVIAQSVFDLVNQRGVAGFEKMAKPHGC